MIKVLNLTAKDLETLDKASDILEGILEFADGDEIGIDNIDTLDILESMHGMNEEIFDLISNLT